MSSADRTPSGTAAHRDRSLRLAVITSLISKVGTIVLRLVSIPIAVHLLGMEMFGVYTAITMAVGMIDMMHIGIGPALTKALAKAVARGDRETERTVFGTSILLRRLLKNSVMKNCESFYRLERRDEEVGLPPRLRSNEARR